MPRFMLLSVAALALTGCGLSPPVTTPDAVAVADRVTVEGTRGLILAELAYNSAASLTLAAANSGLIKGEDAQRVRAINATAFGALQRAKAAQTSAAQALEVAAAMNAIADLSAVAQGNGK